MDDKHYAQKRHDITYGPIVPTRSQHDIAITFVSSGENPKNIDSGSATLSFTLDNAHNYELEVITKGGARVKVTIEDGDSIRLKAKGREALTSLTHNLGELGDLIKTDAPKVDLLEAVQKTLDEEGG